VTRKHDINWPHVVATAICLAMLGAIALAITSYEPRPFSPQESAASHARNLANCGSGMFGVSQDEAQCPRFDALSLRREPCFGPGCDAFELTLHADGRAQLEVTLPEAQAGRFEAHVSGAEFQQLANLVASLQLDRRGNYLPQSDVSGYRLRAGCGGQWPVDANIGGNPGDIEAVARCLIDVKERADWLEETPERGDAIRIDAKDQASPASD
jgi:hypothetical protein